MLAAGNSTTIETYCDIAGTVHHLNALGRQCRVLVQFSQIKILVVQYGDGDSERTWGLFFSNGEPMMTLVPARIHYSEKCTIFTPFLVLIKAE